MNRLIESVLHSLYGRLALGLLVLLALVGTAWLATTAVTTRLYREEVEQRLHRDLARNLLSDTDLLDREVSERGLREEQLKRIFHTLMVVNPRIEVYLLDPDGRILSYSAPEGRVVLERVDLEPVRSFLSGARLPLRGDDPRARGSRKIFSAAAIPSAAGRSDPAGYLYVVLGGEQYDSVVARLRSSLILRQAAGVAVAALLVALVAGLFLLRRLTRRLRHLDRRIRSFRSGSGEPPEPVPGDEIDRMEVAFDRLAERIERQVGELSALDELRRELVANVSHDLRTPIAALQGYVETLLMKGDELSAEERQRYLEIAARHAEQLGRLVARLFELARLDVEEAKLELEPVSLAELAQDVVQKFGLDASNHQVSLSAELPRALPFVKADIRLLERAFDNLIENALAHTPPGGRVTLRLRESADGVEVHLVDTGSGIPEDELPHIFERFYRGRTEGRGRGGAGLGLAITHRILELHGSVLHVESRVDEGTRFSFRLPYTSH